MSKIDNNITLGIGDISFDSVLGHYYQDFTPALVHFTKTGYAHLDEQGIPFCEENGCMMYLPILTIQYGLINYSLFLSSGNQQYKSSFLNTIEWLDRAKLELGNSYVWRSPANSQYNLPEGWISGMYQGQAISLFLRAFQLTGKHEYLTTAEKIFLSFNIDFEDGGFKRIDDSGCLWFEEYPSKNPSYVLNGFIYAILGVLDFYRVTKRKDALDLWNSCIDTLGKNLHKYDVWYWSVYDQQKKQLVSYYYQKNVHIPLMQILFQLTKKEIFNKYAVKWKKNLNRKHHRIITELMYRIQPRFKKIGL